MKTMDEEQRNKLISETLQGIPKVADEVPFGHSLVQNFFYRLIVHLPLMCFHFSEYW